MLRAIISSYLTVHKSRMWPETLRYIRNGKTILFAVLLGKLISFLWKLNLAQLGPQALGMVEIAMTVFFAVQSFSLLGLHTVLIRYVTLALAERNIPKADRYATFITRITLTISLLLTGVLLLFPATLQGIFGLTTVTTSALTRFLWVIPVLAVNELLWSQWIAQKKAVRYGFGKFILPPLTRLLSLVILWHIAFSEIALIAHIAVAAGATLLISYVLSRPILKTAPTPNLTGNEIHGLVRYALPMSGSFLLYVLYGATDVALTSRFLGLTSAGLLSIALLLSDIPHAVIHPILNVLPVHLGAFRNEPKKGLLFAFQNGLVFFVVGSALSVIAYAALPVLVPVLFGEQYLPILRLVSMLLAGKVMENAFVLPIRHVLDFYGYTRITLVLMAVSTIVKISTGIFVIPDHGLSGVGIMQLSGVGIHLLGVCIASWFFMLRASPTRQR